MLMLRTAAAQCDSWMDGLHKGRTCFTASSRDRGLKHSERAWGCRCGSVGERLPSVYKALGFIPSTRGNKQQQ